MFSGKVNADGELLTRSNVEKYLSQYQIMAYYLGRDFYKDVGKAIHSPLHRDENPSFTIYLNQNQRIFWKDYSLNISGTAYDYVMKVCGCTSFKEVLIRINRDFDLGLFYKDDWKEVDRSKGYLANNVTIETTGRTIGVIRRKWCLEDANYWSSYGITESLLRQYGGWPIQNVFLDGNIISTYRKGNPIYGYQFCKDDKYTWKIYWPLESKNRKWLSTASSSVLQGETQLPSTGNVLIITKSMKDVIVLKTLGFDAVATQGETIIVGQEKAKELTSRFTRIFILFDFDYTGVSGANKMKKKYGWIPIFIQNFKTRSNGRKDISDMKKLDGRNEAFRTINRLINGY